MMSIYYTGRDGKLDYDTLGNMVTAHILGEVCSVNITLAILYMHVCS